MIDKMDNKHHSLTEKEKQTITVLSASGVSIHGVAVRMHRSDKVVKKHLSSLPVQRQVEDIRERLIDKYQTLAENCLDKLLEAGTIDAASPRDLATISGISVDKARLLSDLSTQNLAIANKANFTHEISKEAAARIAEAMGRVKIIELPAAEAEDTAKV